MSLILQSGDGAVDASKDPKLGIIAVKVKCLAASLVDGLTSDLPDIGVSGLVETQPRRVKMRAEGGKYDVEATLEGHMTPDLAEGEEFELEGTTSEDPIETNPNIDILLEVYAGKEDQQGHAKWPRLVTSGGGEPVLNEMHGVSAYLVPGLVWTRTSVSPTLPAGLVRTLGTIDTPASGPGGQAPPELDGNRNWLKIRIRASWRGNVWRITESWVLSGPRGWNEYVYRA